MTIYRNLREEIPREEWRTCSECGGEGRVYNEEAQLWGRCPNDCCEAGEVRYRIVGRVSQKAVAAASKAAGRRGG